MNILWFIKSIWIQESWIYYSICFLVVFFILIYIKNRFNPRYVVPNDRVCMSKLIFEKFLLGFALISLFLIPLDLSFRWDKKIVVEKTVNIQVLFDVSLSMTAKDIKPARFDAAKDSMIKLVSNLSWYNISFITFSWIPFVRSPFSDDTSSVVSKLSGMNMAEFPPTLNFVWTAIWDALILWIWNLEKFSSNKNSPWAIILITDWDSNKWTQPMAAASISKNKSIPIFTLWIGDNDYVVWYDYYNTPVTTKINIPLLQDVANVSGGKFYRVLSEKDFKWIFDEISKFIKSQEKRVIYYEYIYINTYLYILLFICVWILLSIRVSIIKWLLNLSKKNEWNN